MRRKESPNKKLSTQSLSYLDRKHNKNEIKESILEEEEEHSGYSSGSGDILSSRISISSK